MCICSGLKHCYSEWNAFVIEKVLILICNAWPGLWFSVVSTRLSLHLTLVFILWRALCLLMFCTSSQQTKPPPCEGQRVFLKQTRVSLRVVMQIQTLNTCNLECKPQPNTIKQHFRQKHRCAGMPVKYWYSLIRVQILHLPACLLLINYF